MRSIIFLIRINRYHWFFSNESWRAWSVLPICIRERKKYRY